MPYYEYECRDCGQFELRRPLSESAQAATCPVCRKEAVRKLSAPYVAGSVGSSARQPGPPSGGCGSGACGHKH